MRFGFEMDECVVLLEGRTESKLCENAVLSLESNVSRAIEKSDFCCEDEEKNEVGEMG